MIALSWSRLSDYQQCPRKFHLKYISKSFPPEDQKSIHLVKGEQLHKQLEDYVIAKNGGAAMPLGFSPEVRETLGYVDKLFEMFDQVHPEAQIACTEKWQPAEWFGKDVGWRSIWDVIALRPDNCFIGDYKSGKIYPYGNSYGQLHLSAVIAMNKWPELPEVRAAYIYIEHKKITPVKVTREELPAVQAFFDKKFEDVQMEKKFEPTANDNCKWCPATKAQCQYSRKL